MQWFKHDTDSTMDFKIKKLIIRYGAVGYAIYFHCLELIASGINDTNITFQLEHDSEIIADDLRIPGTSDKSGREYVEEIMRFMIQLGLFEESNGHIFCFKMLKRLDSSMTSNQRLRKLISSAKENYSSLAITNNHDEVMISHDEVMKEKKRKEESRREEEEKREEGETTTRFHKPSISEIQQYCEERKNTINAEKFFNYYEANGWKVGKNKMKDWKACVRTWEQNEKKYNQTSQKLNVYVNSKRPTSDSEVGTIDF